MIATSQGKKTAGSLTGWDPASAKLRGSACLPWPRARGIVGVGHLWEKKLHLPRTSVASDFATLEAAYLHTAPA